MFEPGSPSTGNWYESQVHHKGSHQRTLKVYSLGRQVPLALFSNAISVIISERWKNFISFTSSWPCPATSEYTFRESTWFSWSRPCTQQVIELLMHAGRGDATAFSVPVTFPYCSSFWPLAHSQSPDSSSFFSFAISIPSSKIRLWHINNHVIICETCKVIIYEFCLEKVQPQFAWHVCKLAAMESGLECTCVNNVNTSLY